MQVSSLDQNKIQKYGDKQSNIGFKLGAFLENYPQRYGSYPDVIISNSALWDINHWGQGGTCHFRYNVPTLLHNLRYFLREDHKMLGFI